MVRRAPAGLAIAEARTVAFQGIEVKPVDVQVQLGAGLPAFAVVGLADKAVGESRERVRAALASLGLALPPKRITVNLAPADLAKEGSHYDLPIALALLQAIGVVPKDAFPDCVVLGELGLDGRLRPVAGVLLAAMHALGEGLGLVCPLASGTEAAWCGDDLAVVAAPDLPALVAHAQGHHPLPRPEAKVREADVRYPDLRDVKGQESAKRALEVAAAGGHNLLMIGPPGAGKSMLAQRLPGLLPPMEPQEILEVSMIASVAGALQDGALSAARPFRSPHHAASAPAMVGGGPQARPGEVSLAHKGVLFLDELPEFQRGVLEALRQPVEAGTVTVARAQFHATYPARFQLVAAMNPCRCGHLDDARLACPKAPRCGAEYVARLSGPLLDRIDLTIDVPAVMPSDLALAPPAEGSADIAARVAAARQVQADRLAGLGAPHLKTNAEVDGELLDDACRRAEEAEALLQNAAQRLRLSARGYYRVIKVARTIADLDGADAIGRPHVAEALSYRRRVAR
ncbi:MAG: YifB family Mg chelatase-like AAA ATPase [Pseudomonadota bacterium]